MAKLSKPDKAKFRFVIRNLDPKATETDIRIRLRMATEKALQEASAAKQSPAKASTELEGAFLGVGETAVILAIVHAVKAGAALAAGGVATEAGKDFYDGFLKKQLRKLNLLPSKFKQIGASDERGPKGTLPKKTAAKKSAATKAATPKKTPTKKATK